MPDLKTELERLNPAQREAVTYVGPGPLLVLAGPGSGKTHVITRRVRYLTEVMGIAPEKILVLTFTKDAATSMKERYLKEISSENSKKFKTVNFGTIHSIFYHLLQDSVDLPEEHLLMDMEKKKLLMPILESFLPNANFMEINNFSMDMMSSISFYKNTGNRKEAERRLHPYLQERFDDVFCTYEKRRKSLGKLDFDDMLADCKRLLSGNKMLRKYWQSRYEHILIDEFQDVNPAQYDVIKLLAAPPYNLFGVGDDDQSIYGFRGADPGVMQVFAKEYHAKQVTLNVNYRCNEEIVKSSLRLIGHNKERFVKKLVSYQAIENDGWKKFWNKFFEKHSKKNKVLGAKEGKNEKDLKKILMKKEPCKTDVKHDPRDVRKNGVRKLPYRTQEEEYQSICEICEEALRSGGTMAVLARTNRLLDRFARELKIRGIPFDTTQDGKVALMTVHGSKGLEFDRVVLLDCNERTFPHGFNLDQKTMEEERRIFYVGMTRAKSELLLPYVAGTKKHAEEASRFLSEF
ncbi:MAG: ATP-dependent helicase [Lachnospiraceae bacterium]|nr:ATP-dependent helicase [Lachnospiraceae bacterium]